MTLNIIRFKGHNWIWQSFIKLMKVSSVFANNYLLLLFVLQKIFGPFIKHFLLHRRFCPWNWNWKPNPSLTGEHGISVRVVLSKLYIPNGRSVFLFSVVFITQSTNNIYFILVDSCFLLCEWYICITERRLSPIPMFRTSILNSRRRP